MKNEKGQAILIVVVALGIFLIAGVGLALDLSQLYAHEQMAQIAADSAAEAAMMSIFQGVNDATDNPNTYFPTSAFTCASGSAQVPCAYARMNGFGLSSDTIKVSYPDCPYASCSTLISPSSVQVTVSRQVTNSFIRMIGGPAITTISATGIAATLQVKAPIPILIIHPTLSSSLQGNGNTNLAIMGGPTRSIQVNSNCNVGITCYTDNAHKGSTAYGGGFASIDLHLGGPNYDFSAGICASGQKCGSDFGVFGGPASQPSEINFGDTGKYRPQASPIPDPLLFVLPPGQGSGDPILNAGSTQTVRSTDNPNYGCTGTCTLYRPGTYSGGIQVKNQNAIFMPGVYVMQNGSGFTDGPNGNSQMCVVSQPTLPPGATWPSVGAGCVADLNGQTGNGMVVYNQGGGQFSVGANGNAYLQGSLDTDASGNPARYAGMLFFEDRTAPANNQSTHNPHVIGGGGTLILYGTIYTTNTAKSIKTTPSTYQEIELHGNPGGNTYLVGEIITDALSLKGTSTIKMVLSALAFLKVQQVALVGGGPHL